MKALSSPLSDSFSKHIQRNGLNIHWTRILQLCGILVVVYFGLRDVIRLSSFGYRLPPPGEAGVYKWNTERVLNPPVAGVWDSKDGNPCDRFPAGIFDKVQVVLKTGIAEERNRLKNHLNTITSCVPNLLIYADYEAQIGDVKVSDALSYLDLDKYNVEAQPDMKAYGRQRELISSGHLEELDGEAGWRLDRFKFLPMVWASYKKRPKADWYIYLESDTYVSWDNLFRLLIKFDHTKPVYMGSPLHSPTPSEERWFAYGGSGIVLSNAAVEKVLARKVRKDGSYNEEEVFDRPKWVKWLRNDTYGESVLGRALSNAEVDLRGFYPSFYPLNLNSIKFGDSRQGYEGFWCEPVVSMHKLSSSEDYEKLWRWEMEREDSSALTFRHLFYYLHPHRVSQRADWDNLAAHRVPWDSAHESVANCAAACESAINCLQYSFHNHKCFYSNGVSLGNARKDENPELNEEERRWTSGWITDRILENFQKTECEKATWLKPSTERTWSG